MSPALKGRPSDADFRPDSVLNGPGRYFDQAVFDLHFVLLSANARRMANGADLPFTVDHEGRVTLKAPDQGTKAAEVRAGEYPSG